MCEGCSNDEVEFVEPYNSKYVNECDSLQQQQVVSLSLLNFTLGDSITKSDLKSSKDRLIKNLKTTKIELKTIYNFDSKMEINEKKYDIKCTLITYMDKIACIDVYFDKDVYNDLIKLFKSKYSFCLKNYWKYKNQSIDIDYENPEKKLYHPELKKYIYLKSHEFKYLRIKYYDHKLLNEIKKIEIHQDRIQIHSDSILNAQKMEIQKQIELQKKTEKEKRISRELKQI
jgi:hypothetical protein